MRNIRATDGSGGSGVGFKIPQRIRTGRPVTRRAPGDICDCGHPRCEHKWGGKACRRINTTSGVRCPCEEFA